MCCGKKDQPVHQTNLLSLDGKSYFPREFVDFKQFNSTKAHAIGDSEEEDMVEPVQDRPLESDLLNTAQKYPPADNQLIAPDHDMLAATQALRMD